MRTLLALLLTVTSLRAASIIPIPFAGTNTLTPAWWTTADTNATGVAPWKAWQAVNTNFDTLQGEITTLASGLPDAQTNAVLDSLRIAAWSASSISLAAGATNTAVWMTNLAGVSYTALLGTPQLLFSFDGSNWVSGSPTLVTNVPVAVMFGSGVGLDTNSLNPVQIPMPAVITNVVYWQLGAPGQYGETNGFWGKHVEVGDPQSPLEAVNLRTLNTTIRGTAWWSAQTDVEMNGHALHPSIGWSEFVAGDQGNALHWAFLGQDAATVSFSDSTPVSSVLTASVDATGTNIVVTLPTNGVASAVRLMFTHQIVPLIWNLSTSVPVVTNGLYMFTTPFPWPDSSFCVATIPSPNPGVMLLSTVLQLPPLTIPTATFTTWGHGAGLVVPSADGNYLQISVGTNAWRRASLSVW
jgi:hypothetical protein